MIRSIAGLFALAGFVAAGAPAEAATLTCHLRLGSGAAVRTVSVDPETATVRDGDLTIRGITPAALPHLEFFATSNRDGLAWGARRVPSGRLYYRYSLDLASGLVTYSTEGGKGGDIPAGDCEPLND